MALRVAYDRCEHARAEECLACIREHIERGWSIRALRRVPGGPYKVVFFVEDEDVGAERRPVAL